MFTNILQHYSKNWKFLSIGELKFKYIFVGISGLQFDGKNGKLFFQIIACWNANSTT